MRRLATFGLLLGVSLAAAGSGDTNKPPPGFTSLFDGKDLSAWKLDEKQAKAWKVEDGTIHYTGAKGARNLATKKNYKDFELWVDWKITPKGDSGIYLRGQPQVQIWDSEVLAGGLAADKDKGSGGLWNNPKGAPGKIPLVNADRKPGEWNTFYIKMVGSQVTVKLNGKVVVDNAEFLPLGKKCPPEGPIELQVHGTPLWFRNIYVKELDSSK